MLCVSAPPTALIEEGSPPRGAGYTVVPSGSCQPRRCAPVGHGERDSAHSSCWAIHPFRGYPSSWHIAQTCSGTSSLPPAGGVEDRRGEGGPGGAGVQDGAEVQGVSALDPRPRCHDGRRGHPFLWVIVLLGLLRARRLGLTALEGGRNGASRSHGAENSVIT